MPKISVIMPVHNTKKEWLIESIESILNQTFTDFEFIIIDDSSTNEQFNVIKQYNDKRIIYYKLEPISLPQALNYGFNIANGEYIARMDADDISLPKRFEKQIKLLDAQKDISIVGSFYETFPEKQIITFPKYPKCLDFILGCCIAHPTVMLRKSDFQKYNLKYRDDYFCEDYDLWSRAIKYLNFYNLQEKLLYYRYSTENKSNLNLIKLEQDTKNVKDNILNFLTEDKAFQENLKEILWGTNNKSVTLWEKLFSIDVKYSQLKKHTIIRLLGLKISIKGGINCN